MKQIERAFIAAVGFYVDGEFYLNQKLDIFAYTSQANGYITKVLRGDSLVGDLIQNYDCQMNRARAARAAKVAEEISGCTAEAVGLAYLYTLPYNVLTIVGPRVLAQIQASMKAVEIELTKEQITYLAED